MSEYVIYQDFNLNHRNVLLKQNQNKNTKEQKYSTFP